MSPPLWSPLPSFGDELFAWLAIGGHKASDQIRCAITVQGDAVCQLTDSPEPQRFSGMSLREEVPTDRHGPDSGLRGSLGLRWLTDGRAELRFEAAPPRVDRAALETFVFDPAKARGADWINLGDTVVEGRLWGQLQARRWPDGSVEASLLTGSGERVLAHARFLPSDAPRERWFPSGDVAVPAPVAMIAETDDRYRPVFRSVRRFKGDAQRVASGRYQFVDGGADSLCAVEQDGRVTCSGRLYASTPVGQFASVSVGRRHACGVRTDGRLSCWGANLFGASDPPTGKFLSVSAGGAHSCGIRVGGTVRCWGLDWQRQASPPDGRFTAVGAGMAHTCGLTPNGRILCWGANGRQQSTPPVPAVWPQRFRSISVSNWHACAVTTSGSAVCWGATRPDQPAPPDGHVFRDIFTSELRTYAVTETGGIVWWGLEPVCGFSEVSEGRLPYGMHWHPSQLISLPIGKAICPH